MDDGIAKARENFSFASDGDVSEVFTSGTQWAFKHGYCYLDYDFFGLSVHLEGDQFVPDDVPTAVGPIEHRTKIRPATVEQYAPQAAIVLGVTAAGIGVLYRQAYYRVNRAHEDTVTYCQPVLSFQAGTPTAPGLLPITYSLSVSREGNATSSFYDRRQPEIRPTELKAPEVAALASLITGLVALGKMLPTSRRKAW